MCGVWGERGVVSDPVPHLESDQGASDSCITGKLFELSFKEIKTLVIQHRWENYLSWEAADLKTDGRESCLLDLSGGEGKDYGSFLLSVIREEGFKKGGYPQESSTMGRFVKKRQEKTLYKDKGGK